MKTPRPGQQEAVDEVSQLRAKAKAGDPDVLAMMLSKAHTHYAWSDHPVSDDLLRQAYDLAKMGPTSMNMQPLRIIFLRAKAKDRLMPHLMEGNRDQTLSCPVTAILAHDKRFFENLDKIYPIHPNAAALFSGNPEFASEHAFRNGTLQAAYFMLALRALGLDLGAMSGFDSAGVDAEFFANTSLCVNFILNIGYGDISAICPRLPRLDFDEVAQIL